MLLMGAWVLGLELNSLIQPQLQGSRQQLEGQWISSQTDSKYQDYRCGRDEEYMIQNNVAIGMTFSEWSQPDIRKNENLRYVVPTEIAIFGLCIVIPSVKNQDLICLYQHVSTNAPPKCWVYVPNTKPTSGIAQETKGRMGRRGEALSILKPWNTKFMKFDHKWTGNIATSYSFKMYQRVGINMKTNQSSWFVLKNKSDLEPIFFLF